MSDGFIITLPQPGGTLHLHRVGTIIVTLPYGDQLVRTIAGAYVWVRP